MQVWWLGLKLRLDPDFPLRYRFIHRLVDRRGGKVFVPFIA